MGRISSRDVNIINFLKSEINLFKKKSFVAVLDIREFVAVDNFNISNIMNTLANNKRCEQILSIVKNVETLKEFQNMNEVEQYLNI